MPTRGQDDLALKVLALLESAKLARDDQNLHAAANLSIVGAPEKLSGVTPRFEAYFAIEIGRAHV